MFNSLYCLVIKCEKVHLPDNRAQEISWPCPINLYPLSRNWGQLLNWFHSHNSNFVYLILSLLEFYYLSSSLPFTFNLIFRFFKSKGKLPSDEIVSINTFKNQVVIFQLTVVMGHWIIWYLIFSNFLFFASFHLYLEENYKIGILKH